MYSLWANDAFFDDTGNFVISTASERGNREAVLSAVEEHMEVVTVTSGARAVGLAVGLGLSAWVARQIRPQPRPGS